MEHRPVALLAGREAVLKRWGLPELQLALRRPSLSC